MVRGISLRSSLSTLIFLCYINDISNCSDKVFFRIFAEDTNSFAYSEIIKDLETLLNQQLAKVKKWSDLNRLSMNTNNKTNYMLWLNPPQKVTENIDIKITNKDEKIH